METMTGAVRQSGPSVSHEERDACLHALGAMHASGKLTLTELEARIQAALAAESDEELVALVRESSRPEVTAQQVASEPAPGPAAAPTTDLATEVAPELANEPAPEPPPVAPAAPGPRRTEGLLFASRLVVFLALTLLVGALKLVVRAAVVVAVALVRLLLVSAWVGWLVCQALIRWSRNRLSAADRVNAQATLPRLQLRRASSKELVLAPRARVPAQREPAKIHPVLVPTAPDPSSAAVVLAGRSTEVVPAGWTFMPERFLAGERKSLSRALVGEDHSVRALVAQLRPLVHRVADRARWRRMTTNACERAAQSKTWRRSIRVS
jgi:hypothetical protein